MNRKIIAFCLSAISLGRACFADEPIASNPALPKEVIKQVEGKVSNSFSFVDTLGSHELVLTIENSDDDDVQNITLRAIQFVKAGSTWKREWIIKDWVDCEGLDIEAKFFPDLITFTDLNNNGITETTVSYSMICTGDVSPSEVKTILREGNDKFAVRGESLVRVGEDTYSGGTFKSDDALNVIPAFKKHLVSIWKMAADVTPRKEKRNK